MKERITGHLETNPLAINFTAIEEAVTRNVVTTDTEMDEYLRRTLKKFE